MKKNSLKVALNISRLSVPDKINRARFIVDAMNANPNVFQNPSPALATVSNAIDDLEAAWNEAVDGGKTKKAIMHDREGDLLKLMNDLAGYVQTLANGDENIVHQAGMEVKGLPVHHFPDFMVEHGADRGDVRLRVKPTNERKTFYRWEYRQDGTLQWQVSHTTGTSVTNVGPLSEGLKYWFRVVFVGPAGESIPYDALSLIVI